MKTHVFPAKLIQSPPLPFHSFLRMKPPKSINLKSRADEKLASRREDRLRLEKGESPKVIQRENSIFPPDFFANARISNLKQVVGK